jgi:SAM-dependent MidA family methyltransferase
MKQLTLPTEMGERFKVIAFSKGLDLAMRGFSVGDQRAYL